MVLRVLESWWAPRRVVRGLRDIPDSALLAVLMLAMLLTLIGQAPGLARAAELNPAIPLDARLAGAALGSMFMMPLLAYLVAGLSGLAIRLTPWRLEARHARAALFWALLAAAPATLLAGLVAGLIGPSPALTLTRMVAGAGFLFIWGAGIAALATRRT